MKIVFPLRLLATLLFIFFSHFSWSQTDSLGLALADASLADRERIIREYTEKKAHFDMQRAIRHVAALDSMVRSKQDTAQLFQSDLLYARLLSRAGDNRKSALLGKEAFMLAKRDGKIDEREAGVFDVFATALINSAEYDSALTILFEGLMTFETDKNESRMSVLFKGVGTLFLRMENYQKAIDYFEQSLELKNKLQDSSSVDELFISIGLSHVALQNFQKAIEFVNEGLSICKGGCTPEILTRAYYALGSANLGLGNFDRARVFFSKSHQYAEQFGYLDYVSYNLLGLADVSVKTGKMASALDYLVRSEVASKSNVEALLDTYERLMGFYKNGDIKKLIHYQRLYIDLKESVYNSELTDNLARVEADYKERGNAAMIKHQQHVIELNEELIEKQNIATISIVAIIVLFLAFIVILYKNNRFKKQIGVRLEKRVQERSDELKTSIKALEDSYKAQEEEMTRNNKIIIESASELDALCDETLQNPDLDPELREYIGKMKETLVSLRTFVSSNSGSNESD